MTTKRPQLRKATREKAAAVRDVKIMFPPSRDSIELLRGDVNTLYEHVASLTNMLRSIGARLPQLSHPMIDDTRDD